MRFVVDASVAVKWLLPELYSDNAESLLRSGNELIVPDLFWAEVASAICKKVRRRELSHEAATDSLESFLRIPIKTRASKPLAQTAARLALESGVSAYDSFYLTLSYDHDCPLVTADRKLYDRVHEAYPQSETLWLPDLN